MIEFSIGTHEALISHSVSPSHGLTYSVVVVVLVVVVVVVLVEVVVFDASYDALADANCSLSVSMNTFHFSTSGLKIFSMYFLYAFDFSLSNWSLFTGFSGSIITGSPFSVYDKNWSIVYTFVDDDGVVVVVVVVDVDVVVVSVASYASLAVSN